MNGSFDHAGTAMTATVVRQFLPSRLERQLLARVFELVCDRQRVTETSPSTIGTAAGTQSRGDDNQSFEADHAGRRAA